MTTHYIDPTVTGPGTGTIGDPWKLWASAVGNPGDIFEQVGEAPALETVQLYISGVTYNNVYLDVTGKGTHGLVFDTQSNIIVNNPKVVGADATHIGIFFYLGANHTVNGGQVDNCGYPVYCQGNTNFLVKGTKIRGSVNDSITNNGGSGKWKNVIVKNSPTMTAQAALNVAGSTLEVDNCLLTLINQGDVTINNTVIEGSITTTGYLLDNVGVGSCVENDCLRGLTKYGYGTNGTVVENNNIDPASVLPLLHFISHSRDGIICLSVDDAANIDYAVSVAAVLNSYGLKLTYFYEMANGVAGDAAKLAALVAAGHKIAVHAYSHPPDLTKTDALVISKGTETLTKTGTQTGDSSTWTGTLTTSGGQNIDLAVAPSDTILGLKNTLAAAGYTVSIPATMSNKAKSICLANISGQSIATPYTAQVDQTAFFAVEISEPKTKLAAFIGGGYVCQVFGSPGGQSDANVLAAVKAAGYLGNRLGETGSSDDLTSLSIFSVESLGLAALVTNMGDGSQGAIRRLLASAAFSACEKGLILTYFAHTAAEFSLTQWACLAEVLAQSPAKNMTLAGAYNYIRTSGLWATADTGTTWTRTFTDSSNYHLGPKSCLIATGSATAAPHGALDIEGKDLWSGRGAPPIGAYANPPGAGMR